MQLSLQLSKLQGTTSYFDGNMGRVGVKSDTVRLLTTLSHDCDLHNSSACFVYLFVCLFVLRFVVVKAKGLLTLLLVR